MAQRPDSDLSGSDNDAEDDTGMASGSGSDESETPESHGRPAKSGGPGRKKKKKVKRRPPPVKDRAPPMSRSERAGLSFPVARIARYLKAGGFATRVGGAAPVFLASVLEYLTAEVLELSGNACNDNNRKTIKPRHILLAIRNDEELSRFIGPACIISNGGVVPNVNPALIPEKKKKKTGGGGKGTMHYRGGGGGGAASQLY